jgi:hypothetical protein
MKRPQVDSNRMDLNSALVHGCASRCKRRLRRVSGNSESRIERADHEGGTVVRQPRGYSTDNAICLIAGAFGVQYDEQTATMVIMMRTIAFCLALLALTAAPAGADKAAATAKVHKVFDIVRGGDKIGTDTVDIERQNDTTTVKIKTDLSVKVMFVEAYRYEHSCNETWKNGQLIAFKSRTNDNGTKHSIDVTAAPDKLSMNADGKHSDLPKTAAPASLWSKEAIHQFDAFDPDTGKPLSIKVTDLGNEALTIHGATHEAHHYKIADTLRGDFAREVWFDGDVLVRIKVVGSDNSVILSDLR